jgi:hypothetical protein
MNQTEKQKMMAGHLYDAGDAEISRPGGDA